MRVNKNKKMKGAIKNLSPEELIEFEEELSAAKKRTLTILKNRIIGQFSNTEVARDYFGAAHKISAPKADTLIIKFFDLVIRQSGKYVVMQLEEGAKTPFTFDSFHTIDIYDRNGNILKAGVLFEILMENVRFVTENLEVFKRLPQLVYKFYHPVAIKREADKAILFLCIKKFRPSSLPNWPNDVVRLVAKKVWDMRFEIK